MSRYPHRHTVENGAGERLTVVRHVPGPLGGRLEVGNVVQPRAGPPMHVHFRHEKARTARERRLGYQRLGEPARFAGPGETVTFRLAEGAVR